MVFDSIRAVIESIGAVVESILLALQVKRAKPDEVLECRMSITFDVSDVAPPDRFLEVLDRAVAIPSLLGGGDAPKEPWRKPPARRRIEAYSPSDAPLVCANDAHALAQAAHDAFYLHHPLVLAPDAVWFCIAQVVPDDA
jgi:hypothetical protein